MTKIGSVAPAGAGYWDRLLHPEPDKANTIMHAVCLPVNVGFTGWALYELLRKRDKKQSTLGQLGWGVQLLLSAPFAAFDIHQLIHAHKYHQQKQTIQTAASTTHHVLHSIIGRLV